MTGRDVEPCSIVVISIVLHMQFRTVTVFGIADGILCTARDRSVGWDSKWN